METAATNDEEMESLVRHFDRIYQDYKDTLLEIQSLKMNCNYETRRREALEATCNELRTDNERLRRLHHESFSKFVDEMAYRAKCQSVTEEIKKANRQILSLQEEQRKMIDMVKQENEQKIHDLEKQVSCLLHKQASDQVMMNQLQQELATHETHIEILTSNLEKGAADLQSKYDYEIQELNSWLRSEQEENGKLRLKLQNAANEFETNEEWEHQMDSTLPHDFNPFIEIQIIKMKQEQQRRDSISLHQVETLKQKIMKLRKENESLKRQITTSR